MRQQVRGPRIPPEKFLAPNDLDGAAIQISPKTGLPGFLRILELNRSRGTSKTTVMHGLRRGFRDRGAAEAGQKQDANAKIIFPDKRPGA